MTDFAVTVCAVFYRRMQMIILIYLSQNVNFGMDQNILKKPLVNYLIDI